MPDRFDEFGEVVELDPPHVSLRIPRERVADRAGALLARFDIDDISVEDPPIEEVIGEMFERAAAREPDPGQTDA